MRARLTLCAAVALSLLSCSTSDIDAKAERMTLDQVTGAILDRPDGPIDVSWPAYLAADERLTERERERFAAFLDAWRMRVEQGEQAAAAAGGAK